MFVGNDKKLPETNKLDEKLDYAFCVLSFSNIEHHFKCDAPWICSDDCEGQHIDLLQKADVWFPKHSNSRLLCKSTASSFKKMMSFLKGKEDGLSKSDKKKCVKDEFLNLRLIHADHNEAKKTEQTCSMLYCWEKYHEKLKKKGYRGDTLQIEQLCQWVCALY